MNFLELINEEIYGNIATVYHRCNNINTTLNALKNKNWKGGSSTGEMYGHGVYTCFQPSKLVKLDATSNTMYGDYVIKFALKGIENFFIFDYNIYKKLNPRSKATKANYIDEQNNKFGLRVPLKAEVDDDNYHAFAKQYKFENHKRVNGIIYHGHQDGDVAIIFNHYSLTPIAWMKGTKIDSSVKWHKIEGRKNFSNENDETNPIMDKDNPKNALRREDLFRVGNSVDGYTLYKVSPKSREEMREEIAQALQNILNDNNYELPFNFEARGTYYIVGNSEVAFVFALGELAYKRFEIYKYLPENERPFSCTLNTLKEKIPLKLLERVRFGNNGKRLVDAFEVMKEKNKVEDKKIGKAYAYNYAIDKKLEKYGEQLKQEKYKSIQARKDKRFVNKMYDNTTGYLSELLPEIIGDENWIKCNTPGLYKKTIKISPELLINSDAKKVFKKIDNEVENEKQSHGLYYDIKGSRLDKGYSYLEDDLPPKLKITKPTDSVERAKQKIKQLSGNYNNYGYITTGTAYKCDSEKGKILLYYRDKNKATRQLLFKDQGDDRWEVIDDFIPSAAGRLHTLSYFNDYNKKSESRYNKEWKEKDIYSYIAGDLTIEEDNKKIIPLELRKEVLNYVNSKTDKFKNANPFELSFKTKLKNNQIVFEVVYYNGEEYYLGDKKIFDLNLKLQKHLRENGMIDIVKQRIAKDSYVRGKELGRLNGFLEGKRY